MATELRDLMREAEQAVQAYTKRIAAEVCDLVDDELRVILQERIDKVVADAAGGVVETISQMYDRDFMKQLNRWLHEVEKLVGYVKADAVGAEHPATLIRVPREIAHLLVGTDKE